MQFLQFHTSSNGDRWLLARNESSEGFVRHEANSASGGSLSNIAISNSLVGNAESPECKSLLRLIGSLVADEPAAGDAGHRDDRVLSLFVVTSITLQPLPATAIKFETAQSSNSEQ
ncbi:MAG: hypothetical protein KDK08_07635 [Rhizobiaceae bacterium]|nr:hypothetical protein [Rhizobiaceae bacterium]